MKLTITISPGELCDRLSILKIKTEKIKDNSKLIYVLEEYNRLKSLIIVEPMSFKEEGDKLYKVNKKLWDIENKIRRLEKEKNFGEEFVKTARKIYKYNDKRALIKQKINTLTNSPLQEIKQHN